ncbi:DP-EP family protein [Pseudoteredinibacter isoporae]|uniref:DP-EP family protein n=1 Tax=Pseudoteredinibacter isoporae TaxID=570281 RepID=UPI0031037A4A
MSTSDTLTITVPKGQGQIKNFTLKPSLPANGQPGDWVFQTIESDGSQQAVENLDISFDPNSNWLQRQSEVCVLVVTMDEPGWRFVLGGTKSCLSEINTTDQLHDVETAITANGKVLTATIKSLSKVGEAVGFAFVAALTSDDGSVNIYQSPDPGLEIRR